MTQSIGKKSEKTPMQHDSWGVFFWGGGSSSVSCACFSTKVAEAPMQSLPRT